MNGLRGLQHLTACCVLICLLLKSASTQDLAESVDKVTILSNDLLPKLLVPLAAKEKNVVLGPFGVASSLGLLLEASNGETRQEILSALNITVDDIASLRVGFKAYCESFLAHSSNPEAAGAYNAATIHSGESLQTSFSNIISQYYCSTISNDVTVGPAISLESHSGVMAHWKAFEKLAVYTFLSHQDIRPFIRRDGTSVPVPMIPQVGVFRTGTWRDSRVIQLPLETNMVDLVILTPRQPKKINSLIKNIKASTVSTMLNELEEEELEVFIPQLASVSKKLNLSGIVQAAGIHRVFDAKTADLSRASGNNPHAYFVDKITQDAFISTSFTSISAVAGVSSHFDVTPNRQRRSSNKVYLTSPFVFLVVHKDTHLVLLAGKIEDPSQVPHT